MNIVFMLPIGAAAILCDLYGRRIPNPLIVTGLLLGISWQWCEKGLSGCMDFLLGLMVPLAVLGGLHYFRMLGAGDIKLLMVTGGFLGPADELKCIWISFLIAALISAAVLFRHRILRQRLSYFIQYFRKWRDTGEWTPYICGEENRAWLHFSIPVFLSTIFLMGGIF